MQRSKNSRKSRGCGGCPFCGPSARCFDPAIRSGRCGDWIWYLRGSKQCRRRYAWPTDPGTVAQLLCRARLTTASRRYSRLLTEEQREACMAAGAKVQSRPRLGQSGPLTGQQYWVRKDAARGKVGVKAKKAENALQVPQPQRVTRSTSERHRSISVVSPEQRPSRQEAEGGSQKVRPGLEVRPSQRVTGIGRVKCRGTGGVTPSRAGVHSGSFSVSGRASVWARPTLCRFPASQGSRGRPPPRRTWSRGCPDKRPQGPFGRRQRGLAGRR